MERQVPWVVPARLCQELQDEPVVDDDDEEQVEKPREVNIPNTCVHAVSLMKRKLL